MKLKNINFKFLMNIFIILVLLLAGFFVYNFIINRNLGLDGQYCIVNSESKSSITQFQIIDNHLTTDNYDFVINKTIDNNYKINSLKENMNLQYDYSTGILELSRADKLLYYINDNVFTVQNYFEDDFYYDENCGIFLYIKNKSMIVLYDINTDTSTSYSCKFNENIISIKSNETGESSFYYVDKGDTLMFSDINKNIIYNFVLSDNSKSSTGFIDIMEHNKNIDFNIDECVIAKFDNAVFALYNDNIYRADVSEDIITIKYGDKSFSYYNAWATNNNIYGNYATDDAINLLILGKNGRGNLTFDRKGWEFNYSVYDKYIKCIDNSGDIVLIPYTLNNEGSQITITIKCDDAQRDIKFYRLKDDVNP